MSAIPDIVGPAAFGIRMGAVIPGSNLQEMIAAKIQECDHENLIDEGDVLCITESVVARAQKNYVSLERICSEIHQKLKITSNNNIGVLFPILSRNRFSLILRAIARSVSSGRVTLQLSFPGDEVGNEIMSRKELAELGRTENDIIEYEEIRGRSFSHPITGVDYLSFYHTIISEEGAEAKIVLSNNPQTIIDYKPQGIIAASIHRRERDRETIQSHFANCITLQDLCNEGDVSSKWGLLGSNLSAEERLKLLPKDGNCFVRSLQKRIQDNIGKKLYILIYGDGAYKDPTTGIYELADPQTTFGVTEELENRMRKGLKYKYLVDKLLEEGKTPAEIEEYLACKKSDKLSQDSISAEGTTPRQLTDVLASLADLVSGSADAGTPVVLVKNFCLT